MPPSVPILPHYPPANFQVLALSGSATDFFPSTFVPYTEAMDRGVEMVAADRQKKTLVEVARENRATHKNPAKAFFTQDARGNAILTKEKH